MKIAIIGTGLYSTALSYQLQKMKDNDIYLWTEQKDLINKFQKSHKFEFLSKKCKFESNVYLSNDFQEVLQDASVIFILVGSKFFQETLQNIKPFYKRNTPIFVGTKGMDLEKVIFFSEYARKYLKCNSYSFFAGPTFASDLILDGPNYLTFASSNKIGYKKLIRILPDTFETQFIEDLRGLEICSVLKNIYAIGSGILNGLKVSNAVYYGYITKIVQELEHIIVRIWGEENTVFSYGGIGDFLMTNHSKTSRNFTLGYKIGMGESKEEIEKYIETTTIEGYESLQLIPNFLKKYRIKNSILETLYDIVIHQANQTILYQKEETKKEIF